MEESRRGVAGPGRRKTFPSSLLPPLFPRNLLDTLRKTCYLSVRARSRHRRWAYGFAPQARPFYVRFLFLSRSEAHTHGVFRPAADGCARLCGSCPSGLARVVLRCGQNLKGGRAVNLGPLGGNLDNPLQQPEARRAHLNAAIDPNTGLPELHRKDGFRDVASAGRKNEQPWHRLAAYMLLAGRTNSEIAAAANVTPVTVSQLRCNRWFQELLATLSNHEGEDIKATIRAEAMASVQKLVELRDFSENERVQLTAATTLLEHAEGKPTQKVLSVSATTTFSSEKDELEAIQSELRAIQQTNQT